MWAAGDLPLGIALALLIHRWLATQEARTSHPVALAADPLAGAAAGSLDGERSQSRDQALAPMLGSDPTAGGERAGRQSDA